MSDLILLALLNGVVGQADYSHVKQTPGFDVRLSKAPPGRGQAGVPAIGTLSPYPGYSMPGGTGAGSSAFM